MFAREKKVLLLFAKRKKSKSAPNKRASGLKEIGGVER